MIYVGAFVSTAGGILKAIERAQTLGIESVMFFATSPRSFRRRVIPDEVAAQFRENFRAAGLRSLWIHGSYLMNFGTNRTDLLRKSKDVLVADMDDCARLGGRGVIFHIGSHGGRGFSSVKDQLDGVFRDVLNATSEVDGQHLRGEGKPWLILENAAGQGGAIGGRFEELGELVDALGGDRVKICFDTQHGFAAGYPIHEKRGLNEALTEFNRLIGLERLVAIHLNDSKVPFSSGRDRHANIGAGHIGEDGIRVLAHHPKLQNLPFLLEVPGADGKGPDRPNVDRLRAIAGA